MLMLVLVSECEEVDIEVKTAMAVKEREQTNGLVPERGLGCSQGRHVFVF